ncbi:phosphate ABC transporter substrate-binding protein [Pasteurellaceae bacterium Pebbles2]|nr:phosphate ABC transporter substrate-binding protein [Pasteurellaceae bacterium Pebbles2]
MLMHKLKKHTMKTIAKTVALGTLLSAAPILANAHSITGAGASFPYPIYAKWASLYEKETGNKVNYQSIGSGGGQQQIIAKTIDFGASDDPMKADLLTEHQLLQFPAIIGGTVPVVNLPEIKAGELKLSGDLLAKIYLGEIKKWNDPALVALNPNLPLPDKNIIVIHRSDGSGTTFGFTNYLSKVSADWKAKIGEGKSVKWATGQGGKGNEGIAAYVRQMKYTIGYVEYAYAKQNNLAWTALQNQAGEFVQPNKDSFMAAASNAKWNDAVGMGVVLTNEAGEKSWPITAASFILMHKNNDNVEASKNVVSFFEWALTKGQDAASELDYVPIPADVVKTIQGKWQTELKK